MSPKHCAAAGGNTKISTKVLTSSLVSLVISRHKSLPTHSENFLFPVLITGLKPGLLHQDRTPPSHPEYFFFPFLLAKALPNKR